MLLAAAIVEPTAAASAACDAEPFEGVRRSVVAEQAWVNGVSMLIVELPAIEGKEARDRFIDYWRRNLVTTRTKTGNGVEVTSVLKGACLYSLQLPTGGPGGTPVYAVSDLRRPAPSLPREFDWPPAREGDVLTDTVSDDDGKLARLLSYRVEKSSMLVFEQCVRRFHEADWKLEALTTIDDRHFVFHGRKRRVAVDVAVAGDGSGAIVTLNFAQTDR